jgi:hypothetical protein
MSWNYRIIRHNKDTKNQYFAIHEVFYNKKDKPILCSKEPIVLLSEEIKGIKWDLNAMKRALKKPILDYERF